MTFKSFGIFVGGLVVGAISGAAIANHYLAVKYRDEEDEEIAKAKARYDKQLEEAKKVEAELRQEIAEKDATIKTLTNTAAGVTGANDPETEDKEEQDTSGDDSSDPDPDRRQEPEREHIYQDRHRRRYDCERVASISKDENYYYDEDSEYDPDEAASVAPLEDDNYHDEPAPEPYVISEYEFAETHCNWSKVAYSWYPYDGSVVSEDGELVDNFERYLGSDWMGELKVVGDECYVRNERLELDALIVLCSGIGAENINLED